MKNMFKGVPYLKMVYFNSDKGGKITSMESTFEGCERLEEFHF